MGLKDAMVVLPTCVRYFEGKKLGENIFESQIKYATEGVINLYNLITDDDYKPRWMPRFIKNMMHEPRLRAIILRDYAIYTVTKRLLEDGERKIFVGGTGLSPWWEIFDNVIENDSEEKVLKRKKEILGEDYTYIVGELGTLELNNRVQDIAKGGIGINAGPALYAKTKEHASRMYETYWWAGVDFLITDFNDQNYFDEHPPKTIIEKLWLWKNKFLKTYPETDLELMLEQGGFELEEEHAFTEWGGILNFPMDEELEEGGGYTRFVKARRINDFEPTSFDSPL